MSDQNLLKSLESGKRKVSSRRRLAALALGAGVVLGIGGDKLVEHLADSFGHSIHEVQEYSDFGVLGISKELAKKHIDPAHILITTVKSGEANPTEVAYDLHAKDVPALANMIATQIGGELNMTAGQELAIPRDLLETPPQK
jgi:hypothetical protein